MQQQSSVKWLEVSKAEDDCSGRSARRFPGFPGFLGFPGCLCFRGGGGGGRFRRRPAKPMGSPGVGPIPAPVCFPSFLGFRVFWFSGFRCILGEGEVGGRFRPRCEADFVSSLRCPAVLEALGVGYFFLMTMDLSPTPQSSICPDAEKAAKCVWIPFGDHPLKLERYREDQHGPCARMTRTNREV